MPDLQPTIATARSVALQFAPETDLLAGDFLRIITSPEAIATARTVESSGPIAALATARGLGAGYSRYYDGLADSAFFNSLQLTINSGGGLIDGSANASAYASGRGDTDATALATNVGLANIAWLDRYGGALYFGSSSSPLSATATAGTGSVLGPLPGTTPTASLNAIATVRGLEGSADPETGRGGSLPFYGQPNAAVRAGSTLQLGNENATLQASASADAKGIEGYTIRAVPFGNGDGTTSLAGDARADLTLLGGPLDAADRVSLNGSAIGMDASLLYGSPTQSTTITGRGVASVDAASALASGLQPGQVALQQLRGIGISDSQLFTNQGADVIRGFAGIAAPQLSLASAATADTAGIDASGIYTGIGNDVIFGKVLNEVEADLDANGDGSKDASVFLDRSAQDGSVGGFDGIRNSTANTGIGNDLVAGASNGSHFYTEIGNDSIDLDRAKSSSLWGGIGNDLLRINGPAQSNVLWGGIGNDSLQVKQGDGNVLDGGYGQDLSSGGNGLDRFIFSEGGAAITAASNSSFGEDLTELPFWATLNQAQKDGFWESGVLRDNSGNQVLGSIDTVRDFSAGSGGDVMEISSSLATITQELWDTKGALFGVGANGQLIVNEASADGSNRVGIVVGTLADIHKLGIGSPSIAYATDTRQLMFDADGSWSNGSISLGTVNVSGTLTKANFAFGATTGNGSGPASSAQGAV
jgi:hypothetical protein